jgi:tRNA(Ile)-lysidine synthase
LTIERTLQAAGDGPILIALSGGGDSVALLHVLAERIGAARLRAIVVDHALREGSVADAARAAEFARALGVSAEIKRVNWDGAPKRSQDAARRARYVALCDAARAHGARIIAVAHTADDQAETVFMRAAKGSGWRGLAGMAEIAPAPVWPEGRGVLLARPLLGERRAALRDMLRGRGAEWIEDPANTNPAFERVRVRAQLAELEQSGFDPMRLARFAAKLRVLVEAVDAEAGALIARAARFEDSEIVVDLAAWNAKPRTRLRALAALLVAAAGAGQEPSPTSLVNLDTRMAYPPYHASSFQGAALGGARVRRRGETLRITRDPGAVLGRAGVPPMPEMALEPGVQIIWDGRLELEAAQALQLIPSPDAPRIALEGKQFSLADAMERGFVSARWLTELQVNHQLGPLHATKSGF